MLKFEKHDSQKLFCAKTYKMFVESDVIEKIYFNSNWIFI